MRRTAGLSAWTIVTTIAAVAILVLLLLPHVTWSHCLSKQSAGLAVIQDFSVALNAYKSDHGEYPPDEPGFYVTRGGPGSVADILTQRGPRGIPYYQFRPEQFNKKGQLMTPLGTPFKYRRNAGKPPVAPDPDVMMNSTSFDMWASGCNDSSSCDPETSEPASGSTMKNW